MGIPLHKPYPYSLYIGDYFHFRYLKCLVNKSDLLKKGMAQLHQTTLKRGRFRSCCSTSASHLSWRDPAKHGRMVNSRSFFCHLGDDATTLWSKWWLGKGLPNFSGDAQEVTWLKMWCCWEQPTKMTESLKVQTSSLVWWLVDISEEHQTDDKKSLVTNQMPMKWCEICCAAKPPLLFFSQIFMTLYFMIIFVVPPMSFFKSRKFES